MKIAHRSSNRPDLVVINRFTFIPNGDWQLQSRMTWNIVHISQVQSWYMPVSAVTLNSRKIVGNYYELTELVVTLRDMTAKIEIDDSMFCFITLDLTKMLAYTLARYPRSCSSYEPNINVFVTRRLIGILIANYQWVIWIKENTEQVLKTGTILDETLKHHRYISNYIFTLKSVDITTVIALADRNEQTRIEASRWVGYHIWFIVVS